jgi:hypothetical protein
MDETFDEEAFRRRVEAALVTARKVLETNRLPQVCSV